MAVYTEKGLNGLYSYLRHNGIPFKKTIIEFGFGAKAVDERHEWYNESTPDELHIYYCNRLVTCRNSGWRVNVIRGIVIELNR